jgi:glutaminyl-tRNA synthetase
MSEPNKHFIRNIIDADLESGRVETPVTRFPPEPNGYLHIGHAKSICLNFGLAQQLDGALCNLRFDDTNPEKEDVDYVDSIKDDVSWLGFEWNGPVRYASSYFDELYSYALQLIDAGKAYVCDLTPDEAREYRGTLKEPGKNSPYRDRSVEENRSLFEAMRNGEFEEGSRVLRAKIDMAAPNMNMRDPIIYRIRYASHHQTGDKWCIYPMYDFTHCLSDAIEGITHSLCTLEFEDHRPLYDWFLEQLDTPKPRPQQIEFARLALNYSITSKRKLRMLVEEGVVDGWDDPRLLTLAAMRRRGFTPLSIRNFCDSVGVARANSTVDMSMLEHAIREDLDRNAGRAMCVLRPIKVVLTNWPEGQVETLSLPNHPKNEDMGRREAPFSGTLYIDAEDFAEEPPSKWKRLMPGGAVRLRGGYVISFEDLVKDEDGNIVEIRATYDPATLGKNPEGYKPKGVIHWVSAEHAVDATVRVYDRLFTVENPDFNSVEEMKAAVNPESLTVYNNAKAEPSLREAVAESRFQFEREGYYCADRKEHSADNLVFNRVVALRDSWGKAQGK